MGPGQTIKDVYILEFETLPPIPPMKTGALSLGFSFMVNNQFLGLARVESKIVILAPVQQLFNLPPTHCTHCYLSLWSVMVLMDPVAGERAETQFPEFAMSLEGLMVLMNNRLTYMTQH